MIDDRLSITMLVELKNGTTKAQTIEIKLPEFDENQLYYEGTLAAIESSLNTLVNAWKNSKAADEIQI